MAAKFWSAFVAVVLLSLGSHVAANDRASATGPEIPTVLEPYVDGERPAMGDYRWMRGDFPGATEDEVEVTKAAKAYGAECYKRHFANNVSELRAMGIEPLEQTSYSISYECLAFNGMDIGEGTTWAQFQDALDTALPLASGVVYASENALAWANDDDLSLAGKLRTRFIADQLVRNALTASFRGKDLFSGLDALQLSISRNILIQQMAKVDAANSEFLTSLIAAHGWPKISVAGEEATHDAWLLVQHADADPALQLVALRHMESLLDDLDVSARDYAYLYDRVMLKIAGKQRYATQFECQDGIRGPQPLESDIASADRYRSAAGMETFSQNLSRMNETYGPCPEG